MRRRLRYAVPAMLLLPAVLALWLVLVPINLTLYVSNQSPTLDPVDIQVEIDGRVVVNDGFRAGGFHNWQRFVLPLRPGRHSITARTVKGESIVQSEFSMFWSRWAVLDYWYHPDVAWRKTPGHFSFYVSNMPPAFQ
jgi:hypothetical protein